MEASEEQQPSPQDAKPTNEETEQQEQQPLPTTVIRRRVICDEGTIVDNGEEQTTEVSTEEVVQGGSTPQEQSPTEQKGEPEAGAQYPELLQAEQPQEQFTETKTYSVEVIATDTYQNQSDFQQDINYATVQIDAIPNAVETQADYASLEPAQYNGYNNGHQYLSQHQYQDMYAIERTTGDSPPVNTVLYRDNDPNLSSSRYQVIQISQSFIFGLV